MTHLLDSSAWLAHLFGEPGVEEVTLLFDAPDTRISVSALSIPEVYARLRAMGKEDHWAEVWEAYVQLFVAVLPVDESIAHLTIQLPDHLLDVPFLAYTNKYYTYFLLFLHYHIHLPSSLFAFPTHT